MLVIGRGMNEALQVRHRYLFKIVFVSFNPLTMRKLIKKTSPLYLYWQYKYTFITVTLLPEAEVKHNSLKEVSLSKM